MKAVQWIDRAKLEKGWNSDYRTAKELGITRSAISVYRRNTAATLDESVAYRLAVALDLEPAAVIIDQAAERSKDDKVRAALLAAASRLYIMSSQTATKRVAGPLRSNLYRPPRVKTGGFFHAATAP